MKNFFFCSLALSIILFFSPASAQQPNIPGNRSGTRDISEKEIFTHIRTGSVVEIKSYLQKGGDPNRRDERTWPLIHIAAERGQTMAVQLLISAGADVNALDANSRSALMKSAYYGFTETVKILLEAKADYTFADNIGETALAKSIYRNNAGVEALLRQAGAVK